MFYLLEISGNKLPTWFQRPSKNFKQGKGIKTGKNPAYRKGIYGKNPKFKNVSQSVSTDHERMPRISICKPIHESHERNPGKILPCGGKITGWEHVHPKYP